MKKIFLVLAVIYHFAAAATAHAASCGIGDNQTSYGSHDDSQSCYSAGNCTGYDLDPSTGEYGTFYGYHANCSGTQYRSIVEITCQRADFSSYEVVDDGSWGDCQVQ